MNSTSLSFQEILELVELVKSSAQFSELRIRSGDLEIEVRRGRAASTPGASALPAADAALVSSPVAPSPRTEDRSGAASAPSDVPAAAAPRPHAVAAASRDGQGVVRAPMVGTVYLAREPGAAPFVAVGQRVAAGDQLCIVEVMKLMNAVTADQAGTIAEILVADGEAVEFGQELFVIASL